MRLRPAVLLTFAVLIAACDAEDPDPQPEALFTAEVTGPAGAPVEGLELFVVYGINTARQPGEARGGNASLSDPFPNPAREETRVLLALDAPQEVEVAVYDLEGQPVAILADSTFAAGNHSFVVDWAEVGPPGVYRINARGETFDLSTFAAYSDGTDTLPHTTLAISLGTTGADGRLVVEDSLRFPSLFPSAPDELVVTNELGANLGTMGLTNEVALVLRDADGTESEPEPFTLRGYGSEAVLTWDPE